MKRLLTIVLILATTAVLTGCGTSAPMRITERQEVRELLAGGVLSRMNYSLAISPVVFQQAALRPQEGVYAASVVPEQDVIQNKFTSMLTELNVFKEVKKIEGQPVNIRDAIQMGRNARSDIFLIPKVKQFNVTYEGRTGNHIPKVIVWSLFEWMSWFMADESYRVDMTCEFQFRHGGDGSLLYSQHRSVSTKKQVSDLQRGIKIWGPVRMPGALKQKNYDKVGRVVGAHALQDMQVSFLRGVLPGFKRSGFERKLGPATQPVQPEPTDTTPKPIKVPTGPKRNIAYIFGVDKYDELTISRLDHAVSDAKAFKEMLSKSNKPRFKDGDLHLFTDGWASRNGIEKKLNDAVRASREKLGTAVFYFAGRGAVTENDNGEPVFYILPQDANAVDLEGTALSLNRISQALRLVNAEQLIIIFDCGFDPSGKGRSVPTGANFMTEIKYPSALYTRMGRSFLAPARAGKPVYESAKAGGGLLTRALLEATKSQGALGGDGALSMKEALDFAKSKLGAKQTPDLFGTAGEKNILFGN